MSVELGFGLSLKFNSAQTEEELNKINISQAHLN